MLKHLDGGWRWLLIYQSFPLALQQQILSLNTHSRGLVWQRSQLQYPEHALKLGFFTRSKFLICNHISSALIKPKNFTIHFILKLANNSIGSRSEEFIPSKNTN